MSFLPLFFGSLFTPYDNELCDTTPVRSSPYRCAPIKLQILKQILNQLLEQGVVRPSKSQYASPAFLVANSAAIFACWSITRRSIQRSSFFLILCQPSSMLLNNFQVPLYFQSSILSRHIFRSPVSPEAVEPSALPLACLNLTDSL